jgi:hypothetical protein
MLSVLAKFTGYDVEKNSKTSHKIRQYINLQLIYIGLTFVLNI